jgi:hypothetical protein
MRKQDIQLQNFDGSHCRWLCASEVDRMVANGEIHRISKRKAPKQIYRYHPVAEASDSRETSPMLTNSDMKALCGLHKVDQVWVERLIGFNLLPETTPVPESGYLR